MKECDYSRTLRLERPRAQVFDAIATRAGLAGWWASRVRGSTRPKGTIRLTFDGVDEHIDLEILTCKKPEQLVWRVVEHTSLDEWNDTTVHFTLQPNEAGCTLSFRHAGLSPVLTCFEDCSAGWDYFLDSLAAFVSTGRGRPFTRRS